MSHGRSIAAVVLAVFALYVVCLPPFIYWADSGELTLGGFLLGLSHPPSFPVFALLVKGFCLLPLGDVAFKTSLAVAASGAIAMGLVYHLAHRLLSLPAAPLEATVSTPYAGLGAAIAAVVLAVSPATWQVALRQEVYTLDLLVNLLILILILTWADRRQGRLLVAAGFLFGIGLGVHSLLTLTIFPPLLVFLLLTDWRRTLEPRGLGWATAAFVLGVSSYLYLPLRSVANPFLDWNDPERLSGFLDSFTKRQELNYFFGETGYLDHLKTYTAALVQTFTPGLVLFGALGVAPVLGRRWRLGVFLLGLFVLNVALIVTGPEYDWNNPDVPGYLLISSTVYAIWIGEGVRRLASVGLKRLPQKDARLATLGIGAVVAGIAWFTTAARVPAADDDLAQAFGRLHLDQAPPGALVLTKSDPVSFLTWYMQEVEHRRPDVVVINRKGLSDSRYINSLLEHSPGLRLTAPAGEGIALYRAIMGNRAPQPASVNLSNPPGRAPSPGPRITAPIAEVLAANLPVRPVLWESGTDNAGVLARSRPLGPLFRIDAAPVRLTLEDHQRNLAFQRAFMARMMPPDRLTDPQAARAMEVTVFNLANALKREEPAPPLWVAEAFGGLWKKRPLLTSAAVSYAIALTGMDDKAGAERVYRQLVEQSPENPEPWSRLGSIVAAQGRGREAAAIYRAGLELHPGDPTMTRLLAEVAEKPKAR